MDINIVQKVFPKYSAAGVQMAAHGVDAWNAVGVARNAKDNATRLDAALQATNAFDHAITASKNLPVKRFVPGVGKYYAGYEAAKAAVTVLVATGVVPGARDHVGRQDILDSQAEFHRALDGSTDTSRFGRYKSADWMNAATEDAATGVAMLRDAEIAKPLLGGLMNAAKLIQDKKTVPSAAVAELDRLYKQAAGAFDVRIATETQAHPAAAGTPNNIGLAELPTIDSKAL